MKCEYAQNPCKYSLNLKTENPYNSLDFKKTLVKPIKSQYIICDKQLVLSSSLRVKNVTQG